MKIVSCKAIKKLFLFLFVVIPVSFVMVIGGKNEKVIVTCVEMSFEAALCHKS